MSKKMMIKVSYNMTAKKPLKSGNIDRDEAIRLSNKLIARVATVMANDVFDISDVCADVTVIDTDMHRC